MRISGRCTLPARMSGAESKKQAEEELVMKMEDVSRTMC